MRAPVGEAAAPAAALLSVRRLDRSVPDWPGHEAIPRAAWLRGL